MYRKEKETKKVSKKQNKTVREREREVLADKQKS